MNSIPKTPIIDAYKKFQILVIITISIENFTICNKVGSRLRTSELKGLQF